MSKKLKLADALRECNRGVEEPAPYHRLLGMVQSGSIPAKRNSTGSRWQIDEADLPAIRARLHGATVAPVAA
jgi:hypothetical protein